MDLIDNLWDKFLLDPELKKVKSLAEEETQEECQKLILIQIY